MNLRRHGSKEWVTEIDQRRRMHLRLNGFRQAYEDLKLNGFGQAHGACKFYHVDRSRQHGCWQLIAKHAATNSTSSGATATVKCYIYEHIPFQSYARNRSKHKTILKGYNWEKSTFTMHNAFYEIIDTGFIVLTPLISILFTLGQFVAQNHTISANRLNFLER